MSGGDPSLELSSEPRLTAAQHRVLSLIDHSRSPLHGANTEAAIAGRNFTINSLKTRGLLKDAKLTDAGRVALYYYRERSISPWRVRVMPQSSAVRIRRRQQT